MNTKLTLTIDKSIIEKAKRYAKLKGRSLSDIIENYLKIVADDIDVNEADFTPIVKSLKGSFKAPKDLNYKKQLTDILSDKYKIQ